MKNYFIIHGTFGHNKENWFYWLEQKIKEKGYNVYNFNYPTPEGHTFNNWAKVLNKVKDKITPESIFICHSSAPIFLIKYCLTYNIKIAKLISVSGANNFKVGNKEFDDVNKNMFVEDVSNFVNLCNERICIYSEDDPYINLSDLSVFAKSINAKEIVYKHAGHFNKSSGFSSFEDILKFL